MMTIIVSIFVLLQAVNLTRSEDVCENDPTEYCSKDNMEFHLPTDVSDLNAMCSQYLKYIDCLEEYENSCPDGHIIMFFVPYDSSMNYRLFREICDTNSRLYIEYNNHVSCIQSAIDMNLDDCANRSEPISYDYYAFLRKKIKNGEMDIQTAKEEYFVLPSCLWRTYRTVCLLTRIESSCGAEAAAVSREIAERSSFPLQSCNEEDYHNLKTGFLGFLEDSDEIYLKQILHSKELEKFVNSGRLVYDEK